LLVSPLVVRCCITLPLSPPGHDMPGIPYPRQSKHVHPNSDPTRSKCERTRADGPQWRMQAIHNPSAAPTGSPSCIRQHAPQPKVPPPCLAVKQHIHWWAYTSLSLVKASSHGTFHTHKPQARTHTPAWTKNLQVRTRMQCRCRPHSGWKQVQMVTDDLACLYRCNTATTPLCMLLSFHSCVSTN
jgi:hypothetical protein